MSAFSRYIGIDYSGAETPEASLKGLRVYCAVGESAANEVPPPPSPRKYWTRRGIAHWLAARLAEDVPTIVGIDHGFSFPLRYFEAHQLAPDWPIPSSRIFSATGRQMPNIDGQLSSRWSGNANLSASIAVYHPQAELSGGRCGGKFVARCGNG
jgi:hypothetical protein